MLLHAATSQLKLSAKTNPIPSALASKTMSVFGAVNSRLRTRLGQNSELLYYDVPNMYVRREYTRVEKHGTWWPEPASTNSYVQINRRRRVVGSGLLYLVLVRTPYSKESMRCVCAAACLSCVLLGGWLDAAAWSIWPEACNY